MRLWLRLALVVGVIAAAPLLVVGGVAVRATREAVEVRPEEALAQQAGTAATAVGTWLDGLGGSLAGWRSVWSLEDQGAEARLGFLRAVWLAHEAVVTVALVDAAGEPVAGPVYLGPDEAPPGRAPGNPARAAALLERAPVGTGEVTVGAAYRAVGAPAPSVPVRVGAVPSLIVEAGLDAVTPVFEARGERYLLLVDDAGTPVLGALPPGLPRDRIRELVALGHDLSFRQATEQGEVRGAVARVPGSPWSVIAVEPADLAAAAARRVALTVGLVGAALAAGIAGLAVALRAVVTRPVEALKAEAEAVAGGDYGRRLGLTRDDELGELAAAFDAMAASLQASQAEIGAFNTSLQRRVEEATAELREAQAELVRAGQLAAVHELGAGLAHELNNPLAAILGLTQLLQARGHADAAGLARIEAQAQRCREVVAAMVRVAAGEAQPGGVGDLGAAVRDALGAAQPAFVARGLSVALVAPDAPVPVKVDAGLVEQVVARFLAVLRVGMPQGAVLHVEIDPAGPSLRLRPDAYLGSAARRDDERAAGMQLWYARRLVDAVGARVLEPNDQDGCWTLRWPAP